jgi:protein-tyrosine phosphatase
VWSAGSKRPVIDLHSHVAPGIDDGPPTIEGSLALARSAAACGTRILLATPHVSSRYENDATTIASAVAVLGERLAAEGVAIELRAGAEIAMTRAPELSPGELADLALGDGPWLLLEPPFALVAGGLPATVAHLRELGHPVVLAHPERCPAFHRDPTMLAGLIREGAVTSVTAASLVGRFGERPRRFALSLAREGLLHNVASDAHDEKDRPPSMRREMEQAGLAPLGEWLTEAVPAAILAGEPRIPRRPEVSLAGPRRSRWRLPLLERGRTP